MKWTTTFRLRAELPRPSLGPTCSFTVSFREIWSKSLSMTPIEKPEQARRLLAQGRSATILSLADWTRACVQDEEH